MLTAKKNEESLARFSKEELKHFSELLTLRTENSDKFRKQFKDLAENQSRFLDYKDIIESEKKKNPPVLNGFYLAKSENELVEIPVKLSSKNKSDRRRCHLL